MEIVQMRIYEIKLTKAQQAWIDYTSVREDIKESLGHYSIDPDMYNDAMEALGSAKRIDDEGEVDAKTFEEDFRMAWNKLSKKERMKFKYEE